MKISVTKADIAKGKRGEMALCPIVLAFRRKGFLEVEVGSRYVQHLGVCSLIELPLEAQAFVDRFDSGEAVKPFIFTLSIK